MSRDCLIPQEIFSPPPTSLPSSSSFLFSPSRCSDKSLVRNEEEGEEEDPSFGGLNVFGCATLLFGREGGRGELGRRRKKDALRTKGASSHRDQIFFFSFSLPPLTSPSSNYSYLD